MTHKLLLLPLERVWKYSEQQLLDSFLSQILRIHFDSELQPATLLPTLPVFFFPFLIMYSRDS